MLFFPVVFFFAVTCKQGPECTGLETECIGLTMSRWFSGNNQG